MSIPNDLKHLILIANSGASVHLIPEIAEHFNKTDLNVASFIKPVD